MRHHLISEDSRFGRLPTQNSRDAHHHLPLLPPSINSSITIFTGTTLILPIDNSCSILCIKIVGSFEICLFASIRCSSANAPRLRRPPLITVTMDHAKLAKMQASVRIGMSVFRDIFCFCAKDGFQAIARSRAGGFVRFASCSAFSATFHSYGGIKTKILIIMTSCVN